MSATLPTRHDGATPARPLWLLAELTYACPLQCPYCSNPTEMAQIGREIGIIDIDGHPGFTARGNDASCEAGVESGDGFLHWSVNYAFATPPTESCAVVEDLARNTVGNAK